MQDCRAKDTCKVGRGSKERESSKDSCKESIRRNVSRVGTMQSSGSLSGCLVSKAQKLKQRRGGVNHLCSLCMCELSPDSFDTHWQVCPKSYGFNRKSRVQSVRVVPPPGESVPSSPRSPRSPSPYSVAVADWRNANGAERGNDYHDAAFAQGEIGASQLEDQRQISSTASFVVVSPRRSGREVSPGAGVHQTNVLAQTPVVTDTTDMADIHVAPDVDETTDASCISSLAKSSNICEESVRESSEDSLGKRFDGKRWHLQVKSDGQLGLTKRSCSDANGFTNTDGHMLASILYSRGDLDWGDGSAGSLDPKFVDHSERSEGRKPNERRPPSADTCRTAPKAKPNVSRRLGGRLSSAPASGSGRSDARSPRPNGSGTARTVAASASPGPAGASRVSIGMRACPHCGRSVRVATMGQHTAECAKRAASPGRAPSPAAAPDARPGSRPSSVQRQRRLSEPPPKSAAPGRRAVSSDAGARVASLRATASATAPSTKDGDLPGLLDRQGSLHLLTMIQDRSARLERTRLGKAASQSDDASSGTASRPRTPQRDKRGVGIRNKSSSNSPARSAEVRPAVPSRSHRGMSSVDQKQTIFVPASQRNGRRLVVEHGTATVNTTASSSFAAAALRSARSRSRSSDMDDKGRCPSRIRSKAKEDPVKEARQTGGRGSPVRQPGPSSARFPHVASQIRCQTPLGKRTKHPDNVPQAGASSADVGTLVEVGPDEVAGSSALTILPTPSVSLPTAPMPSPAVPKHPSGAWVRPKAAPISSSMAVPQKTPQVSVKQAQVVCYPDAATLSPLSPCNRMVWRQEVPDGLLSRIGERRHDAAPMVKSSGGYARNAATAAPSSFKSAERLRQS